MEADEMLERERHQFEQIDAEVLQIEEVDSLSGSSDDDDPCSPPTQSEYTFDAGLASLHTYLGEVEETNHRLTFLDGGATLNLPLFYLEGVVLFPGATLPLRVIRPSFVSAVERSLGQVTAPYTIGVVRIHRNPDTGRMRFATVGTTAEIRQYRRLEDGSVNIVTRGQQRFRVRRHWIDVDGAPCGEVQIIQEDLPLRTPQDTVSTMNLPFSNDLGGQSSASLRDYNLKRLGDCSDKDSEESFEGDLSLTEMRLHHSAIESCLGYDMLDLSASSDDERNDHFEVESKGSKRKISDKEGMRGSWITTKRRRSVVVSKAFLPHWVYQMYDSFFLAQKAADMWKLIVGTPSMDSLVRKPDILSFYVASKIPVSESARQELLEIDGISYRLKREIELLERLNHVRCKNCQSEIARRSDMLVMSSEGPLGAYVNPDGFVHEIMTLLDASGVALVGRPVKEYSWFPGYAWTIANCANCFTQLGWLFTATNKKLKPRSFWGIRCCQVADEMK